MRLIRIRSIRQSSIFAPNNEFFNEDISSIKTAADYDGKAFQNVSRIMTESFPTDIEFYQNIY